MCRKARIYCESEMYHVIMRGNNQQLLFYSKKDRLFFLQRIKKYSSELNIDIYAYCLMPNHVHLLIGKANSSMSLFIQKLANSYVYYFNRKYERTGHLFQGRFKSEPVKNEEYFKTVLRYILQNPQKAGIAEYNHYQWSSFEQLKTFPECKIIKTELIMEIFGGKDNLFNFISIIQSDFCMEYQNKLVINDKNATNFIQKKFKISSPFRLQQLSISDQIEKIKILKENGLSCNQILRLTGLSKKIIRIA